MAKKKTHLLESIHSQAWDFRAQIKHIWKLHKMIFLNKLFFIFIYFFWSPLKSWQRRKSDSPQIRPLFYQLMSTPFTENIRHGEVSSGPWCLCLLGVLQGFSGGGEGDSTNAHRGIYIKCQWNGQVQAAGESTAQELRFDWRVLSSDQIEERRARHRNPFIRSILTEC